MKTLTLALAATAIVATSSTFVSTAEAGRRGHHRLHFHLHQLQLHQQRQAYRSDDDDDHHVRRKKVIIKQVAKPAEKPAPVAVAKFADGQGRQFDLASKVWFDGKSQCWMGNQPFTFKSGSWLYGETRWIESSAGWGVTSGVAPEQVSCEGIKAFEAKLKPAESKPVALKKVEPKVETIEKAELPKETLMKPARLVGTAPEIAAKPECKKYFPSVGEMVAVPCNE